MVDTISPERRSALMKRVKQANTKPEVTLRKELHRLGFRYVIGDKRLPGTPDIVLPKYKAAIFVHGCFWHGHDCRQGRSPSSNVAYWVPKIEANKQRDARKEQAVRDLGWKVLTVWECELKKVSLESSVENIAAKIDAGRSEDRESPQRAVAIKEAERLPIRRLTKGQP